MKFFTLTMLLLVAMCFDSFSQVSCSEQLRQAERRFDEGLLEVIPGMVKPCMDSGFTKEEKINAYKLLIQTYIFSNRMQEADETMYRFLRDFPEYTISPSDPKEFINLYSTYRTEPIMRIEPFFGMNYTMPYVYEYFAVGDLNSNTPNYKSSFGFTAGVSYTDEFFEGIDGSIGLSFLYSRVGYFYQVFDHTYLDGNYSQIYLGLPVSIRYSINYQGFDFFAKGGVEIHYLIHSKNDLVRGFTSGADNLVGSINLTDYHRKVDIRPVLGLGFSPRFGNVNLIVDAGVRLGTIIPVNKELRYANYDAFERFYFIEDKWIFNHLYFNVAYVFSIYKPTKIR